MIQFVVYYYQAGGVIVAPPAAPPVVPPVQVTPRLAPNASPIGVAVVLAYILEVGTRRILGEVHPLFRRVLWLLNNYGEVDMVFAADDPALVSGLIAPGRHIVLQFDNGLPDWGGVIDVPIERDGYTYSLRAYEASYVLKGRLTGRNVTGVANVGELAQALINAANAQSPTGIAVDFQDVITDTVETDYHYTPIWDVFTADIAHYAEWKIRPHMSAAGVVFRLFMAPRIGRDLSARVRLVEGVNMQPPQIIDQGPIVNEWIVAGSNGDWDEGSDSPRMLATATDVDSRYRYGLRQAMATADTDDETALANLGAAQLAETAQPYQAVSATVLNLSPGTFAQYDIGDWIMVELHGNYGANELKKQVIGRELDVMRGTCEVILQ